MTSKLVQTSLQAYFHKALQEKLDATKSPITQDTQAYLVHLLCAFCRSERVWAGVPYQEKHSLAPLLIRAQEAQNQAVAAQTFKHIGDSSLYMAGRFWQSLHKRGLGTRYYVDMGRSAYGSLSALSRGQSSNKVQLYDELNRQFEHLVKLLQNLQLQEGTNSQK